MKSLRILANTLLMVVALSGTSGCVRASDFDKATLVGTIKFKPAASLRRDLLVLPGKARLVLAVRNYRCAPVEATIRIAIVGQKGNVLTKQISLSQLTWSFGEDSCDAIGYLEAKDLQERPETRGAGEMRFQVESESTYTFDALTMDGSSTNDRQATLWLIYGDRVPTAAIFGSEKKTSAQ